MRVYCEHCKHLKVGMDDCCGGVPMWCNHVSNRVRRHSWFHTWIDEKCTPEELNGANTCVNFFPKWHKMRKYRGGQ